MQQEQQPPASQETQPTPEHGASDIHPQEVGVTRRRSRLALLFTGVIGAFLLGFLMVKLFPEFAVSKVIYAMVGR